MSTVLAVSLLAVALLLACAVVAAFFSYERAVQRITEGTRTRLVKSHPYGSYESGWLRTPEKGGEGQQNNRPEQRKEPWT